MARSLYRDVVSDSKGNALYGFAVTVYDHGTTTPVTETIYTAATGLTERTNPFTIEKSSRGEVTFYLDVTSKRVDVKYSGPGVATETVTLDGLSPTDLGAGGGGDVAAHEAAGNPHPTYHTAAEVAADIVTHEGAGNPHPTYETSAEAQAKVDAHVNDAADAHDASAISFAPAASIAATDVQAAITEVGSEAGRLLGQAVKTVAQSGITSVTDITDLSVVVAVAAGRRVRVDIHMRMAVTQSNVGASGRGLCTVVRDSTTIGAAIDVEGVPISGFAVRHGGAGFTFDEPGAGTFTYKVRGQAVESGASLNIEASAASPCRIAVYDDGPI